MELLPPEALEILATRFDLMASPARLDLIQRICQKPRRVSELVELTGMKQANVSKHLGRLLRLAFVRRETRGGEVFYSIGSPELIPLCETMRGIILAHQREVERRLSAGG